MTAGCFGLSAAGCSINGWGIGVNEKRLHNDTTRVIDVTAFGFHLSTVPGDSGIFVGHTHRRYYFAKPNPALNGSISVDIASISDASVLLQSAEASDTLAAAGDPPLAVVRRDAGVGLDANPRRIGLSIGVRAEEWISIPESEELLVYLQYGGADASKDRFWIQRSTP